MMMACSGAIDVICKAWRMTSALWGASGLEPLNVLKEMMDSQIFSHILSGWSIFCSGDVERGNSWIVPQAILQS